MDFSKLEEAPHRKKHTLPARVLTSDEAKQAMAPLLYKYAETAPPIRLFGKGRAKTWTVAAMTNLTEMGKKITPGRLHRVLRTALPINPQFNLYLNANSIEPEKLTQKVLQTWLIGEADKSAEQLDYPSIRPSRGKRPELKIPNLGPISGQVELFEDALAFGKSEQWGRSHGFFVMVRGRLINMHDELFGLEALSHGAFQRFRMVVQADGLDNYLRATRENVSADAEGVQNFRKYLKEKFNEARSYYLSWLAKKEKEELLSFRLSRTPRSLSRQPLLATVRKVLAGQITDLKYIYVPVGINEEMKAALLAQLEAAIEADNFFEEVKFEALGMERGVAIFDVANRSFKINILHPFFSNFAEHFHSPEPYQFFAIAEVLTEAYLIEEGLSPDQTNTVLARRDRFLRELVLGSRLAAPIVAQLLEDARHDFKGFEDAVYEGMKSLGFDVSKMGGSGKPDGIALAHVGVRTEGDRSLSFKVAYDAKSTGEKVSAKDLQHCGRLETPQRVRRGL